ncbi:MAG TPA: hypothetical protein VFQ68_11460, partial [Streptosporangiaceae bacterium]|nr:hypothetical protein [Streptosporangiaceae bacterium]
MRVAVAGEDGPGEDALDRDVDKDPLIVVLAQEPVPDRAALDLADVTLALQDQFLKPFARGGHSHRR